MRSMKRAVTIYLSKEDHTRLKNYSKAGMRSVSSQVQLWIKEKLSLVDYHKQKGKRCRKRAKKKDSPSIFLDSTTS